ncbi:putative ribosome-binding factor A, mitochondrial [Arapaima gigas]
MFTSKTLFFLRKWVSSQCSLQVVKQCSGESRRFFDTNGSFVLFKYKCGQSHIHTSCSQHGSRNLLKKFESRTKKKPWYPTHYFGPKHVSPPNQFVFKPTTLKKQNQEESGRICILNSLLLKAVRDLLDSPEVNSDVYNLGVEISKVRLAGDYSSCRVYWRTSGSHEKDAEIQQVLDRSSSRIRYLLISHQIIGGVPPVMFLKDKEYAAISEVENLLKVADFGEEPKEENSEKSDLAKKDVWKLDQAAHPTGEADAAKQRKLFGVDHEALMKQILDYKQKPKGHQSDASEMAVLQQKQLVLLEELRRQKVMLKKKKKSKHLRDDDITPEDYLLAKYEQEQDSDEQDEDPEYNEMSQFPELGKEERK